MCKKRSKVLSAALSIAILAGMLTTANAAPASFDDVPADAWFAGAVTEAVGNGYVSGMGDGRFAPYDDLTYAQVFSMIVNAGYKNDEASYEFSNKATMDAAFNGGTPWWGYYAYFLNVKGLLKGTIADNNVTVTGVIESKVTRYTIVQIVYNVLKDKGVNIAQSTIDSAKSAITDWSEVHPTFQNAVAAGYGLKIISGFEDGSFGGTGILNRAQSCVIINNMLDVIAKGGSTAPVDPKPEPPVTPPTTGETEIKVTRTPSGTGTSITVADNGFGTGTLNNGKPITEENIIALLKKAEAEFPSGITWAPSGTGNNWYMGAGSVARSVIMGKYFVDSGYACGGFAAMISDYVFGKNNNPARQTTVDKIRPGDIIVMMNNNGTSNHVATATTNVYKGGIYDGRILTADGNTNGKVSWPNQWTAPFGPADGTYWVVYTRYPDGNGTTDPGTKPETPVEPPASTGEIEVTKTPAGNGTAHFVANNGFGTGTLNNGKPITEENVLELLAQAEKIWPTGTMWTESGATGNNWYMENSAITRVALSTNHNTNANYACGGFAAMISDYVFGKTSNDVRRVTDMTKIRPGDIIVAMEADHKTADHVLIAMTHADASGNVYCAGGNEGGQINWPTPYDAVSNANWSQGGWVVYTRYPD